MLKHQRGPGIKQAFLKIPKPMRIYFGVVIGVALVIGSVFVINEMQNRLKPPTRILLEIEDEIPQTNFLKIYAWETQNSGMITYENYPLNGHCPIEERENILALRQSDTLVFSEMKTKEPVEIAYDREARILVGDCVHSDNDCHLGWEGYLSWGHVYVKEYNGVSNTQYSWYTEPLLIAKADAYIEVTGAWCGTNKGSDEYIKNFETSPGFQAADDNRALYHILARPDHVRHETNGPSRDPDEELGTGEWNGEARDRFYYQSIDEVYPDVPAAYKYIHRRVNESAMLFSAYSKTDPDILLAQAEVKITHYSSWGYDGMDSKPEWVAVGHILTELGIDTDPDNYGYTTAEIVDYWENPEYLGE